MSEARGRVFRVFSEAQIWVHKHLVHLAAVLILTSLPFVSRDLFGWIAYALGLPVSLFELNVDQYTMGLYIARIAHRAAGILLIIISAVYAAIEIPRARNWHIWPEGRLGDAIRNLIDYYLRRGHPKFGKYNLGQKLWTWAVIIGVPWMSITGVIMMLRGGIPEGVVSLAHQLHLVGAVLAALGLIIHVYAALGIPEHRPMVEAMFRTGAVPEEFLRKHHPLFYKKLAGEEERR